MKRVLIAGGSHSDIPLIKEAKKKGLYVITSGNNPKDLGHKYSDEFHLVDFSKKEEILKLAQEYNIDYIIPSCHDLSLISCAYVAEKLALPGYDNYATVKKLHHKDLFREFALKENLKSPKAWSLKSIDEKIDDKVYEYLPLIVKPIDLGGGKGITKIVSKNELDDAVKKAFETSKAKRVIIEEFKEGTLHSFSTYIQDGKVFFYYADNEFSFMNPYGVSTSTSPAKDIDKVLQKLILEVEKFVKALSLNDGILHLQYLLDGSDFHIVEFTRRMPGDCYTEIVELSTSVNYTEMILNGFCGIKNKKIDEFCQKGYFSRHCLMANRKGKIKDLSISLLIKDNIIKDILWYENDDIVYDEINQKFGLFLIEYKTLEEMQQKNDSINKFIRLDVV